MKGNREEAKSIKENKIDDDILNIVKEFINYFEHVDTIQEEEKV